MPYYVPVEERVEGDVFAEVSAASSILDHFCGDSLITLACSYIYPACNPERGTYKSIYQKRYSYVYICLSISELTCLLPYAFE